MDIKFVYLAGFEKNIYKKHLYALVYLNCNRFF